MNTASAHNNRRPFARIAAAVGAVAAVVAECNDAQTRLTSLRNTPARFGTGGTSVPRRADA